MLKALIVDDEPFIRKGILNKIDWESLSVQQPAEANDAIEALEYLEKNHVDLVLTDIKMPEMDGIRFIEKAKMCHGDKHRFVIISGYGEFEIARQAIKFGVTDYLLKPVNEEELEGTIRKLVYEITSEGEERNYRKLLETNYSNSREIKKDKLFSGLIMKNTEKLHLNRELAAELKDFKDDNFIVLIAKIDNIEYQNSSFCEMDENLVLFAVRNVLDGIFSPDGSSSVFMNIRNEREFVVLHNSSGHAGREQLKRQAAEGIEYIYRYLKARITFGIGRYCTGLEEIYRSYSQASFAVRQKLLKGPGRVYDIEDVRQNGANTTLLNENYKKLFISYLQDGRKEEVMGLIGNLFDEKLSGKFFYNHASVYELCMEFHIFLSRYIQQAGKDINEFLGEKYQFIDAIMELGSLEEISAWLKNACNAAIDYVQGNRKLTGEEIVQEVKAFIGRNYAENITLNFIAQKYFIHPNYFCRIFRNMAGMSFMEYITNVRIDRAKELLSDPRLRLNRVCELVGYDDPRYFSQVFKKCVGISPSEYQTQLAR